MQQVFWFFCVYYIFYVNIIALLKGARGSLCSHES